MNLNLDGFEQSYDDSMGDPRRCPRHPHIKTSSPDGMFDTCCGECEAAMDAEAEAEVTDRRIAERKGQ